MSNKVQINLLVDEEIKRQIEKNAKQEELSITDFIITKCVEECGYYILMLKEKGKKDRYVRTTGFENGDLKKDVKNVGAIKIDTTENIAEAKEMSFGMVKLLKKTLDLFEKDIEEGKKKEWVIVEVKD